MINRGQDACARVPCFLPADADYALSVEMAAAECAATVRFDQNGSGADGARSVFFFAAVEDRTPRRSFTQYHVGLGRNSVMLKVLAGSLVLDHGFEIVTMNCRAIRLGLLEYRTGTRTAEQDRASNLRGQGRERKSIRKFPVSRTGT